MSPTMCALAALTALAAAPETVASSPYVTVNLGIEVNALEQAARDTAAATRELASAVGSMAESPSLSADQRARLMDVVGRVDTLSARVVTAVDRLPDAVRESGEPLGACCE